jgi:hypothetical protein
LYYREKELEDGVPDEIKEGEADFTTDLGDDTDAQFDLEDEEDFNPDLDERDVHDMKMND